MPAATVKPHKAAPLKNFRPLGDRVVVERDPPESMTEGGIVIPDVAQEKLSRGTVVAVGPGVKDPATGERRSMDIKVGDRVLFGRYAGDELEIEDREILLIREPDVAGVIGVSDG